MTTIFTYRSYPAPLEPPARRPTAHIYEASVDTELGVFTVSELVADEDVAAVGSLSHAVGEINARLRAKLLERMEARGLNERGRFTAP